MADQPEHPSRKLEQLLQELTPRQAAWLEHYRQQGPAFLNATKAAELAGYSGAPGSSQLAVQGHRNLRNPTIQHYLHEAFEAAGCTAELDAQRIREAIDATRVKYLIGPGGNVISTPPEADHAVRLRAIELKHRLLRDNVALKQMEAGRKAEDVAREVGVSKHTLYAWKAKYGGMDARHRSCPAPTPLARRRLQWSARVLGRSAMSQLEISSDEFWRLAGYVLGLAKDYLRDLDTLPTFPPNICGLEVQETFAEALPREGQKEEALADLISVLRLSRPPSPRFFGYVLGSGDPIGALADLLASVLNQNVTAWRSSPAAVTIERVVVGWLAEAVGCRGFSGSLTGGGSSANTMGLAMAREARLPANEDGAQPALVYASQEVHMSIPKAVALLGLGRKNLRLIATDDRFRMIPAELERQIEAERAAGKKAIAVVASAGTVNTGAIDPLSEIAGICLRHHLWLHVDGAYGALAAMAAPGKFRGLELADSLSLDPHKWLYQPLDCGCLLFRDAGVAQAAFAHSGDYARVLSQDPVEGFAFFEESMELSRRFRALKVWLSLRYHGLDTFRDAIRADLEHAQQLAELVRGNDQLELLAPVELSAVCFRHLRPGASEAQLNELNTAILKRVIERGRVYISNASIGGKFALRACFVNHRTKPEDVQAVVEEVVAAAAEL